MLMKNKFQSKAVPRGTRTIWRYLGALFLLFTFAIGNVWANQTDLISDVTLPDVPASSLDMSSQTTFTPDANGWIVMQPNADIRNKDYTWFTAMAWNTTSVTISDVSSFTAPFNTLSSESVTTVRKTGRTKAIRFTGATDISFLVLSGGSRTIYVSLYSYNTTTTAQTLVDTKSTNQNSATELLFTDLTNTTTYVAYMYESTDSNGSVAEIAIKKYTATGPVDPVFTYTPATYTIGDPALDLSTKLTSTNTTGAITFAVSTADAGTTGASIASDKNFTATAVGTAKITVSQAASTGYNAKTQDIDVTVVAPAPAACPEGLTISGTKDYTAGQTISLEAALEAGNGEITYNWYKGDDLATAKAAGSIGTGASFSKASCAAGDAGNYFCVATKDACSDAESAAYAVTVAAAIDPWIIKVALSGDISSATKTMSGSIGGDAAYSGLQNSSAPYKIGSNSAYLNLTLSTGYFYPGDSVVLDLSKTGQIFYGATDNDNDHLLGTTTAKDGIHYFILPASFPANTNSIHVGRTSSTYNGTLSYMAVYRTPICPQTLTISGETDYVPGDEIELTASLAKGNGAITYQWYKGGTANENKLTGKTNAKLEIEDCVAGDAGDYYCIASKEDCSDAVNAAAYSITVNDFVAVTGITISPASPTVAAKSKITLTAEVAPVEATNKVVEWSVKAGSEAYASVNATTGEVTGKAAGNAVIVATATDGSGVFAEKTVVVTPFVCPTSGTIYSFVSDGTKAPGSNTYCPASGVQGVVDIATYATVSGGLAQGVHTTTSNNPIQIQTSTSAVKLSHADGYFRALLECPLQEGDTIKFEKTNKVKMAFDSLRTKVVEIASGTGANKDYYIVPATYVGEDTIMVYYGGSSVNLTAFRVIRPEKFAVTFNMHGHGDAVTAQNIISGGKVTEPATTDITGWDFGGWYKTYVAEPESYSDAWDFENDVVSAAVELHAKWTAHVASNDVALGTLSVNGEAITIVPSQTVYAVELPMGTSDIPTVVATANDVNAKACTVTQATAVDGSASIYIKAEDNSTEATYTINFSVATSKDIELVFKTGTTPCVGSASTATQILSNNAVVSTYINQIAFTNVEGAGDNGAEGGSLNVGKKAGNMFTLSAKPGYAFQAMNFLAKIQDATCEYSIDGSDWTTLASTNTGGDECYAPFTSGTVHEFRLRSTGAEGVWIRNMQLTIIEACTPITLAWDEEPVEFEVGKAGYAIAATANNGGAISYASADNTIIDVNASTGALTIAGLGSVALSASTPEGDGTTYCANGGDPIVLSKTVKTYYLVAFDGQNGEATDEVKYFSGDAAIAQPSDPSFPGHTFQGWFDAASAGNPVTFPLTPSASRTIYAQWTADCAGATITTQPEGTSYLTGRTPAALVCEATAGNGGELTYEWFTCDDEYKANPVAATATPSTAVAGTFYYFCKVTEAGCAVEAFSDVVTITVADKDPIYLTWVDVTANNTVAVDALKSLYAPEVSASNVKNTSTYGGKTGYKFNSDPAYIAIEGAPFKAGDIVEMFVTNTTADKARVFNANEAIAANVVAEGAANMVQGANKVALTADANNLYLRRGNDFGGWNPSIAYVAVYRACAPILNKMTVAGVDGTPDNTNHIAIEVPFSTTDDALDAIVYDWVSNDAAWTAAHNPAVANAWEWGVENTVTLTDKDNDQSVYYVTISKAAASSDATLSALTVNGQAIALADGVFEYSFELPYGTSVVPTVAATPNHVAAVATVDPCTLSGATITVVPESGAGDQQVYTLTFVISKWKEIVIWDGSTMSAVATSPDAATGFAWAVNGFGSISSYTTTYGEKSYSKYLPSGGSSTGRYMTLTVPEGYVAKFYVVMASHSDGSERGMFIGSNLVKNPDATSVLELSNNDRDEAVAGTSEIVGAGTWYINPNASIDFQEIRAYLRPGYGRTDMLGNGVLGTVCVDHNVAIEDVQGATMYELMGRDYSNFGKLAFDEITSGELQAGAPYVFQAHGDKLVLFYGETSVADPVDKGNGMYGTFEKIVLTELEDIYYFAQKALWSCKGAVDLTIAANRAYVKLSEVGEVSSMAPAPGRRRILMGVNGENQAQGFENIENGDAPMKVMIDGTLYILRGEKVFDATGRLVK